MIEGKIEEKEEFINKQEDDIDSENLEEEEEEEEEEEVRGNEIKDKSFCSHAQGKHINSTKCTQILKKKNCNLEKSSYFCLQCGKIWLSQQASETHSIKSNHPIVYHVETDKVTCCKCSNQEITNFRSNKVSIEFVLIKNAIRAKFSSSTSISTIAPGGGVIEPGSGSSIPPCGLRNLGNTCFFNSSIQVLAQSQRIQEYFNVSDDRRLGQLSNSFGKCLSEVVNHQNSNKKKQMIFSPSVLFKAVCTVAPHFSGFDQQDAQELLTFLLGGMDDEASNNNRNKYQFEEEEEEEKVEKKYVTSSKKGVNKTLEIKNSVIKPIDKNEWKVKHSEFWFSKNMEIIERVEPDEDEEPSHLLASLELAKGSVLIGEEEEEESDEYVPHYNKLERAKEYAESKSNHEQRKNVTKDLFQMELENIVICDDCNTETIRKESQYMLSLSIVDGGRKNSKKQRNPVDGDKKISDLIEYFLSNEQLSVKEGNGFQCEKCASRKNMKIELAPRHDAMKRVRFSQLNDVLIIHLKRFHHDRDGNSNKPSKIDDFISVNQKLNLGEFGEYQLIGVIEHLGKSINSGHYIAYVNTPSSWYRCSDESVTKASETHVFNNTRVYIAIYERR